ncbi:hypothetical protein A7K94_0219095, partial [Modestobacter sp. VKM Ac-2676]
MADRPAPTARTPAAAPAGRRTNPVPTPGLGRRPARPDRPAAHHAADRWLRRLSTAADRGALWLGLAVVLGRRPGRLRRAAVRGVGSQLVSS